MLGLKPTLSAMSFQLRPHPIASERNSYSWVAGCSRSDRFLRLLLVPRLSAAFSLFFSSLALGQWR